MTQDSEIINNLQCQILKNSPNLIYYSSTLNAMN